MVRREWGSVPLLLATDEGPRRRRGCEGPLLLLYPVDLPFPVLVDTLEPHRASWVPRMVRSTAVGAAVVDFLLLFVKSEALLCPVASTADPIGDSAAAVVPVVSISLATEATERLGSVWTQVEQPPVAQIYLRRKWAPDGDEDLLCLVLLS